MKVKYASMVLNEHRKPIGAQKQFEDAFQRMIEKSEDKKESGVAE